MYPLIILLVFFTVVNDAANIARIVGGRDAPEHKYPYQVSLRYKINGETAHMCSGSIINKDWILTAAHCMDSDDSHLMVISAGTNYLNEIGDEYTIQFYITHENFENFYNYDIALIRVNGEIKFTEYVKPIPLAGDDLNTDYMWAEFAGWGSTYFTGPTPNNLQEIDLMIIHNDVCKIKQTLITNLHICTFTRQYEGTCHGDSGGPLVINGYQVGIGSYITTPCAANEPDVFTRVSKYIKWIEHTMQKF